MKTSINGMNRFGSSWRISLACGHRWLCSPDQLQKDQLFLGKQVVCSQPHESAAVVLRPFIKSSNT